MFNIEDTREILFEFEMASLDLKEYVTYKLQVSHTTRAHTWLPYPLLVIGNPLKIDLLSLHVHLTEMTLKCSILKIFDKFFLISKWRHYI